MDTNKKHTLPPAIILAACSLLLAGACDNYTCDGMESDTPAKEVPLNFNASIEKTAVTQARTIEHTKDFTGNSYSFGMSITKSENGSEIFQGSSDMTATMEHPSSFSTDWNWSFIDNVKQINVTPVGPEGKALKVVAYYPCVSANTKNVYTDGIPFDFSDKDNLQQTDLLYNIDTIYSIPSSVEPMATIPLHFRHAYTWIVLNITKYMPKEDEELSLSSVSLDNLGGSWIKNQGTIDPETGLVKNRATAGPIGVTVSPPANLSTTQVHTYDFLVPSFMDANVGDGEIVLVLKVNEINELFILDKAYLNRSDDGKSFGFRQGYKNTYNLVYNNSELGLSIQNWSSEEIDGTFGDSPAPSSIAYRAIEFQNNQNYWPSYPNRSTYLSPNEHPFENYLTTVAYGANGDYVLPASPTTGRPTENDLQITDDINVYSKEKVYPLIEMTKTDVSVLPVPWEDENGGLVAKELCRKYNGGNHHDWRLPRAAELRAVFILSAANGSRFSDLNFKNDANRNKPYWTGTEVRLGEAWSISIDCQSMIKDTKIVLSPLDKKMTASVRCVRDVK